MASIDKLEIDLKHEKNQQRKMEILEELRAFYDNKSDYKKSIYYLKKQLKITLSDETMTSIYRLIAENYRHMRKLHKAEKYNNLQINLAEKLNLNEELQKGYCNMGINQQDIGDILLSNEQEDDFIKRMEIAQLYLEKSLNLAESFLDNPALSTQKLHCESLYNLGNLYYLKGQYDAIYYYKSKEFLNKTIEYSKKINYSQLIGKAYCTMGLLLNILKKYSEARDFFLMDEKICRDGNDKVGLIATWRNLGSTMQYLGDYNASKEYYEKAKKITDKSDVQGLNDLGFLIGKLEEEKKIKHEIELKISKLSSKNLFSVDYIEQMLLIIDELIFILEDYKKAKIQISKLLENISKFKNPSLSNKIYNLAAINEKNLGNKNQAKKYFEESEKHLDLTVKNLDTATYLNEFANLLDDMKIDEKKTESLYHQAYQIAKLSESSFEMQKIILKNLESFYQNIKQTEKWKNTKILIKTFDTSKKQKIEEEESSIEISSCEEELIKESPKLSSISFIDELMEEEEFEMAPKKEEKKNKLFQGEISKTEFKRKETILPNYKNAMDYYLQYCRDHLISHKEEIHYQLSSPNIFLPSHYLGDRLILPLLKSLPHLPLLFMLNLENNSLTQKSFEKLEKLVSKHPNLFKKLKKLNLAHNSIQKLEFLLKKMNLANEIEEINISGNSLQNQMLFQTLSDLENLQILKLKGCGLSHIFFNKKMNHLKEIDLSRNRLNFSNFSENLKFLPNLEKANFSYNYPELILRQESKFQIFGSQNNDTFEDEIRSLKTIKLKGIKEILKERRETRPKYFIFFNHAQQIDLSFCEQGFLEFFLESMLENCLQGKIDGNECYKSLSSLKIKNEGVKRINENLFRLLTRVLSFIESLKIFDLEGWDLNYDHQQTLKTILLDKNKFKNY